MAILFGCNESHYANMSPQVAPITGLRCFNSVRSTWPVVGAGQPLIWSPGGIDFTKLMAGTYDAELISAMQQAPAGSMLNFWHEPEYYRPGTAAQAREVMQYGLDLVRRSGTSIPYGSISTGNVKLAHQYTIPGLDYYGLDLYDTRHDNKPAYWANEWSVTMPPGPRVIAETNTNVPANRPYWFKHVYNWLLANKGVAMTTFWNDHGALSGPWLPGDTATIAELNKIAAAAQQGIPAR